MVRYNKQKFCIIVLMKQKINNSYNIDCLMLSKRDEKCLIASFPHGISKHPTKMNIINDIIMKETGNILSDAKLYKKKYNKKIKILIIFSKHQHVPKNINYTNITNSNNQKLIHIDLNSLLHYYNNDLINLNILTKHVIEQSYHTLNEILSKYKCNFILNNSNDLDVMSF